MRHEGGPFSAEAIVVGLDAGGVAIGRVLNRLGFNVLGLYLDEFEVGRVSNCFGKTSPIPEHPAALARMAGASGTGPTPVFLTTDKALSWLRHDGSPGPHLHVFKPEEHIYAAWFDKIKLAEVDGSIAGTLNAPRSVPLVDWERFARKVEGPWILKPSQAVSAERYHIPKTQFIRDEHELQAAVEKYRAAADAILLQEWIPGEDHHHGFVGGYVDRDGRISVVQTGRKVKQFPAGMGVSIHCKTDALPELEASSRDVLRRIGYRGFFEFEWKWDARARRWRFIEINLRPWATLSLSLGYGMFLLHSCLSDIGMPLAPSMLSGLAQPVEWIDDFALALQAIKLRARFPLRLNRCVAHAYWDRTDPRPLLFQWSRLLVKKLGYEARLDRYRAAPK